MVCFLEVFAVPPCSTYLSIIIHNIRALKMESDVYKHMVRYAFKIEEDLIKYLQSFRIWQQNGQIFKSFD